MMDILTIQKQSVNVTTVMSAINDTFEKLNVINLTAGYPENDLLSITKNLLFEKEAVSIVRSKDPRDHRIYTWYLKMVYNSETVTIKLDTMVNREYVVAIGMNTDAIRQKILSCRMIPYMPTIEERCKLVPITNTNFCNTNFCWVWIPEDVSINSVKEIFKECPYMAIFKVEKKYAPDNEAFKNRALIPYESVFKDRVVYVSTVVLGVDNLEKIYRNVIMEKGIIVDVKIYSDASSDDSAPEDPTIRYILNEHFNKWNNAIEMSHLTRPDYYIFEVITAYKTLFMDKIVKSVDTILNNVPKENIISKTLTVPYYPDKK